MQKMFLYVVFLFSVQILAQTQSNNVFKDLAGTYTFYKSERELNHPCNLSLIIDAQSNYQFNLTKIKDCNTEVFFSNRKSYHAGKVELSNYDLNDTQSSLYFGVLPANYRNNILVFYDFFFTYNEDDYPRPFDVSFKKVTQK